MSAHDDHGLDALDVDRFGEMDTIYEPEESRLAGSKAAGDWTHESFLDFCRDVDRVDASNPMTRSEPAS